MVKFGIFLLKVLSRLPMGVLKAFSTFLYFIVRLLGYRRKVIMTNLEIAFPEKSHQERRKIRIEFYRIFADYLVEFILLFSLHKDRWVGTRIFEENISLLNKIKSEGRPTFALAGHRFNWEWIAILVDYFPQEHMYAVYKPLKNKELDKEIDALRFRLGGKGIATKEATRYILAHKNNADALYYFLVDQSPKRGKIKAHTEFFGKKTKVFNGYENLIKKTKGGVVYVEAEKLGFAQYIYHFKEIKPIGEEFEEGELVETFYRELEASIRKHPANWLWSHRRWKEDFLSE